MRLNLNIELDDFLNEQMEKLMSQRFIKNRTQIVREALAEYLKKFAADNNKSINNATTFVNSSSAPAPVPANDRTVVLLAFVAKELGLENDMVPREGLEARLIAAGFFDLEQEGKQWYGKHPNYKSVRVPLGIERTGD